MIPKSPAPTRVLFVEDQTSVRKLIGGFLRGHDMDVFEASTLSVARRIFPVWKPDILLLDLILDNENGMDFLRDTKGAKAIVLSSKRSVSDRITALETGAIDYLTKPVDPRELLLKIRAIARLGVDAGKNNQTQGWADLKVDLVSREITGPTGLRARLSRSEITLLKVFLEDVGVSFTKGDIARSLSSKRFEDGSRAVDVMVSKLRNLLRSVASEVSLVNLRDQGYRSIYNRGN